MKRQISKNEQIIWLYSRIRDYAQYIQLNDDTFKDDVPMDLEYAKKHFNIPDYLK